MRERLRAARLTASGAAGLLLLNYPLMSAFARSARVFGVPLLWVYLLALWAILITLLVIVVQEPA